MTTIFPGASGDAEPDPEDWPEPDPSDQPLEAIENEADDLSAALPPDESLPADADEADVLDQRAESGIEDEEEDELDPE